MTEKDELTKEQGHYLLRVARRTIKGQLFGENEISTHSSDLQDEYLRRRGTFVTLTINSQLRGCIGHILPEEALIKGIKLNAINAAFRDPRFRPLNKNEFSQIKIEISILTEPKHLVFTDVSELLEKLHPGIDGVIIKQGFNQATFLPQVWEQLPSKEQFLSNLCLKAGLDDDAWMAEGLEVSVYQAQVFEE